MQPASEVVVHGPDLVRAEWRDGDGLVVTFPVLAPERAPAVALATVEAYRALLAATGEEVHDA